MNRYVVALLRHTRDERRLALGGSPRSGIALLRLAKARALSRAATSSCPRTFRRWRDRFSPIV
jgi:MoxR-like ATPase